MVWKKKLRTCHYILVSGCTDGRTRRTGMDRGNHYLIHGDIQRYPAFLAGMASK